MGGPSWYRGVVSGGYPICSFRQFLARMCRFATIQNVTDRQTTTTTTDDDDRRHWIPKAPVRSAKKDANESWLATKYACSGKSTLRFCRRRGTWLQIRVDKLKNAAAHTAALENCNLTPKTKPVKPGFLSTHKPGFTGLKIGGLPSSLNVCKAYRNSQHSFGRYHWNKNPYNFGKSKKPWA